MYIALLTHHTLIMCPGCVLLAMQYKSDSPLIIVISSVIAVVFCTIFGLVIVTFVVHR